MDSLRLSKHFRIPAEVDIFPFDDGTVRLLHGPVDSGEARLVMAGKPPESSPTVQEALDAVGNEVPLILEIKHLPSACPAAVAAFVGAVQGHAGPIAVSSFAPQVLDLRSRLPGIPIGLVALLFRAQIATEFDFVLVQKDLASVRQPPLGTAIGLWTYLTLAKAVAAVAKADRLAIANVTAGELRSFDARP